MIVALFELQSLRACHHFHLHRTLSSHIRPGLRCISFKGHYLPGHFAPNLSNYSKKMDQLTEFLSQTPHIHHATPQSPEFKELLLGFVFNESRTPAIVVRPRSAEEVAALIPMLTKNNLQFAVKVGGHDMFGRSQVSDGVIIDLREISHVYVDAESQTARLGGGVMGMDMLETLQKHNVTTPYATTPVVGQTGWTIFGGYGPLSSKHGLGVDQIVGAKVVDAEGKICEANETILTGIRGGGGTLGVIVELTVKVYPSAQVAKISLCLPFYSFD
jgi:FAD/FMN-containing dehydrogenase